MAFRKDNKQKNSFSKISIGLASPEEILEKSSGEVLKPETINEKKVRRERMGHIKLVVPVAHIWYFRSLPNKIGYLLGLPSKKLDAVIYYERYVVINPGIAAEGEKPVQRLDLLSEEEYFEIIDRLQPRRSLLCPARPGQLRRLAAAQDRSTQAPSGG